MDVGLLRDRRPFEHRVGLTPGGVKALTDRGHRVYVESNAGLGAGFTDEDYRKVGATIVFSDEEVLLRSQMVLRISPPLPAEYDRFQPGQVVLVLLAPRAGAGRPFRDPARAEDRHRRLRDHRGRRRATLRCSRRCPRSRAGSR